MSNSHPTGPWLALLAFLMGCADLTAPPPSGGPGTTAVAARPAAPVEPARAPTPAASAAAPDPRLGAERIGASHVLIGYQGARRSQATRSKDEAKKLAEQVLGRARGGSDFAALARELSDDPTAKARGGELGEFDRFSMVKPFADAAFALPVGGLSAVVETEFGFHVIKRTK